MVEEREQSAQLLWFEAALAQALQVRRAQQHRTQEQIAREARAMGLDWTRATVANIETGRRHLTPGEFVALPLVYDATLSDLMPDGGPFVMGGQLELEARDVQALLRGTKGVRARLAKQARVPAEAEDFTEEALAREKRSEAIQRHLEAIARGTAERHAARRLSVSADAVALASLILWGHGLTEERDRRVEARAPADGASRVARGHVTRQLLQELRTQLDREED